MTERFLSFFSYVDKVLGGAGVFLVCVLAIFLLAIITVFFALFKRDFNFKKRIYFFLLSTAIILSEYALSFYISGGQGLTFITAAAFLVFSLPVFTINKKEDAAAKELVKLLDQKILKANSFSQPEIEIIQPNEQAKEEFLTPQTPPKSTAVNLSKKEKTISKELDFTHVKNVIARLDFYGLSPSEKKLVEGLKEAISSAESNNLDQNVKSKINDGLGALLKIMSKYGI